MVLLRNGAVEPLLAWDLAGSLGELLVATPWEAGSPTRRSWGPRSVLLLQRRHQQGDGLIHALQQVRGQQLVQAQQQVPGRVQWALAEDAAQQRVQICRQFQFRIRLPAL